MRYLKYLALVGVFLLAVGYAQAQVSVGIGIGVGPGYVGYVAAPECAYGYYDYYPYACAPYGYYAPRFFVRGVFIGAGPWYGGRFDRDRYDRDRTYFYARGRDDRRFDRGRDNGYRGRAYGNGYVGRGHDFGRENNHGWRGNNDRRGNFRSFGRGDAHRENGFRGGSRRGPSGRDFHGNHSRGDSHGRGSHGGGHGRH